jgi:predicted RNA-binding Zn ribbon-like protein
MQPALKPPGELCLDFANTLRWHASDQPVETLSGYDELVAWARKFEVLTAREANQLLKEKQNRGSESKRVLQRGLDLREAVYRIITSNINDRPPAPDDIKRLNMELEVAYQHLQVARDENGYHLAWTKENAYLDRPLWPVARSAIDLLTSAEVLARVGQCADDRGCGWLYLDWSKNHSRRWCDINDCGNRAKQRRFYERSRQQRG